MPVSTQGSLLGGRYRVLRHLGSGGMAWVLLCRDERLGRDVAVKRLHADSPTDVEQRFVREAKLGASLNHPNLVSLCRFERYAGTGVMGQVAWPDAGLGAPHNQSRSRKASSA